MRNTAILAILAWATIIPAWAGTITYTLNATWTSPPSIMTNTGQQYDLAPPLSHFTVRFIEPTSFDTSTTLGRVGYIASCSGSYPLLCGSTSDIAGLDGVSFFDPEQDDLGYSIRGLQGIATFQGPVVTFHFGEWDGAYGAIGMNSVVGLFTGTVTATPEPAGIIMLGSGLLTLGLGDALHRRRRRGA